MRSLLLLFEFAKRWVAQHTDGAGKLSKLRIVSATEELHQIADDVRDAEAAFGWHFHRTDQLRSNPWPL